ncbi:MAG TPA: hypothetical protein VMU29_13770 [Smithella sp.]|nr:hypothetical protein [Smithella sp.]
MKPHLSFEVFDEYLKITLSGEGNPFAHIADINDTIMTVKKLSEEHKRSRVLIDAINLPNIRDMQKFYLGALVATIFGRKFKLAMLRKPEHVNKFAENIAINSGANVHVDSNEQKALEWLLS